MDVAADDCEPPITLSTGLAVVGLPVVLLRIVVVGTWSLRPSSTYCTICGMSSFLVLLMAVILRWVHGFTAVMENCMAVTLHHIYLITLSRGSFGTQGLTLHDCQFYFSYTYH